MKEFTTREKLELDRMGSRGNAIIDFDENIIVLWENWKGTYEVEIYEMIDTPEETGLDRIECRLSLIEKQTTDFKDNGHALAWAMKQL